MKKSRFGMMMLAAVLMLVIAACTTTESTPTASSVEETSVESVGSSSAVVGGVIEPAVYARLAFQASGVVTELRVMEGDVVQQGDVLAVIGDSSAAQMQVAGAELALVQAQNGLSDLIDSAGLSYTAAWQQVLENEAALSDAQKLLDDFDVDAYDDEIDTAKETIKDREKDVQDAQDDLADYLDLDKDNATRKAREDAVERAEDVLRDANTALQKLENDYAQLQLNVRSAQELLSQAQRDLEDLKEGPAPDDLALAKANVAAAEAQLSAAETALKNLELTAPFSGTIAKVLVRENEMTSAGSVVVVLADFSEWVIKTDDLTEFDILSFEVGQSVDVWTEVMKADHFSGIVTGIELLSQMRSGDVTYTITIQPETADRTFYWGMNVTIALD